MLTRRLIQLIERDADIIAQRWLKEVQTSPLTPKYRNFPAEKLLDRVKTVYSKLEYWLDPNTPKEEIEAYYTNLGKERFEEGFSLEEVIMALLLTKKYLWQHIVSEGLPTTSFELYQALELNNEVVMYFDKAVYYTVAGYRKAEINARKLLK